MKAEPSVSHCSNLFPRQFFACQDSRQHKIKNSCFVVKAAGRYPKNRDGAYG